MMTVKQSYQGEGWRLSELLAGIVPGQTQDVFVFGLSSDSRRIGPGDLFLACSGRSTQGHRYINDAIKYGASAVLYDAAIENVVVAPLQTQIPVIAVVDLAAKIGLIAERFYGSPSKELVVTGVTGTNGKTSSSHIIAHVLSKAMATPAGLMGTLGYGLCGSLEKATHTTPDAITVHRLIRDIKNRGAKDVVMEVSSHGLDQGRIVGVEVDVAVFSNITRDHLDYHETMQAYVDAKKRLFAWPTLKCAVINVDDAYCQDMMSVIAPSTKVIGYSVKSARAAKTPCLHKAHSVIYGSILKSSLDGSEILVECEWGCAQFSTSLLGEFNVYNLLAALAVLLWRGVAFEEALARLATVRPFAGRMEVVARSATTPTVVIDYAHTPDALEKALKAIRQLSPEQKLWCVFGCGGDRDQGKRAIMGQIAEQFSDRVVVTDDNPRSEQPQDIVRGILSGMANASQVDVVHDRAEAIAFVLRQASGMDVVLIAGKGHEDYQEINGERRFFSDLDEVKKCLAQGQVR